jgi:hypothetical protein
MAGFFPRLRVGRTQHLLLNLSGRMDILVRENCDKDNSRQVLVLGFGFWFLHFFVICRVVGVGMEWWMGMWMVWCDAYVGYS